MGSGLRPFLSRRQFSLTLLRLSHQFCSMKKKINSLSIRARSKLPVPMVARSLYNYFKLTWKALKLRNCPELSKLQWQCSSNSKKNRSRDNVKLLWMTLRRHSKRAKSRKMWPRELQRQPPSKELWLTPQLSSSKLSRFSKNNSNRCRRVSVRRIASSTLFRGIWTFIRGRLKKSSREGRK